MLRSPGVRTLILCGGKGTRAYPHSIDVPKPLMEVGDRPVLSHVMEIYARQGFTDFVLAAGYKAQDIVRFANSLPPAWSVEVHDTGESAGTGERLALCIDGMGSTFFLTYADGLADVDLQSLLDYHQSNMGAVTMTSVPLPSQYGTVDIASDSRVTTFREKPRLFDHWINGGFFVMESRVSEWLVGDDLERDVLPALAAEGELFAYLHDGFWRSMDTYKDSLELGRMALGAASPPWWVPTREKVML